MTSLLDSEIRIVNTILAIATLPAAFLLLKIFWDNGTHDKSVRRIFVGMFIGILLSEIMTIIINVKLLYMGTSAQEILFTANIRNLIKNMTFFTISWGLLYTSVKGGDI